MKVLKNILMMLFLASSFAMQAMQPVSDDDAEEDFKECALIETYDDTESALIREIRPFIGLDLNQQVDNGNTFLHCAAVNNDYAAAQLLISHGAFLGYGNAQGKTPYDLAPCRSKVRELLAANYALLNLIIEPLKVDIESDAIESLIVGGTAYLAHLLNTQKKIELSISQGASVHARNCKGETPLHKIIDFDCGFLVAQLLFHGANRFARDDNGMTPLNRAVVRGLSDAVKALLVSVHGEDVGVNCADDAGKTPLYWAVELGRVDCVELLLNAGAKPNLQFKENLSPRMLAIQKGNQDILSLFGERVCVIL